MGVKFVHVSNNAVKELICVLKLNIDHESILFEVFFSLVIFC